MAGLVKRIVLVVAVFGGLALSAPAGAADVGNQSATPQVSMFVIGDGNAGPGSHVTFWGAQWAQENLVSGGAAPDSFKGYATNVTLNGCTGTFTTEPGNSSDPPSTPSANGTVLVLVASNVTKSGPVISGTFSDVVAVSMDPGYGPDPGHPGTGTVTGPAPGCDSTGGGGGTT